MKKVKVPGELCLFIAVIINSFGVALMAKSNFGISTISSVPYVFSHLFSNLSFGTFNYLFQTLLVATLMLLNRKINFGYAFSFLMGIAFGKMLDVHALWLQYLPDLFAFHVLYFLISFVILTIGICLSNNSLLPIIPTDVFPRDLASILHKPYKYVKTTFDLSCLCTTLILSICLIHQLVGIGVGTVICAITTGKAVSIAQVIFNKYFISYRAINIGTGTTVV